jgi:hypothetical protein
MTGIRRRCSALSRCDIGNNMGSRRALFEAHGRVSYRVTFYNSQLDR